MLRYVKKEYFVLYNMYAYDVWLYGDMVSFQQNEPWSQYLK